MKTIGLLGGTGWSSTIGYYALLNTLVNERLGGYHSAKIILKSIDYHDIMSTYGENHEHTAALLKAELLELIALKPDCIMICCNSLHKYYDMIKDGIHSPIPVFHAVELVAQYARKNNYNNVLLLATKFTMEDGFFARKLEEDGISVTIPTAQERAEMQRIHGELMQNIVTQEARNYFRDIIARHAHLDAVVLGCTNILLSLIQAIQYCQLPIL